MKPELFLAISSVMVAIVVVFTLIIRYPTPAGYLNLSDVAIIFASFSFGPFVGLLAGGLGTALADLIAGYPQYIPISFVVHGLEGLVIGLIAKFILKRNVKYPYYILSFILTVIIVAIGYYLLESIFLYGFTTSFFKGVIPNTLQAGVGFVGGILLYFAILKIYPAIQQFKE